MQRKDIMISVLVRLDPYEGLEEIYLERWRPALVKGVEFQSRHIDFSLLLSSVSMWNY